MRSIRSFYLLVLLPLIAVLALLPGCEGDGVVKNGKRRPQGDGAAEEVARVALAPSGYGTVTGKIVYEGTPPPHKPLDRGANETACHAPPDHDQENYLETWIVDKNGGVKNAVIFLQPPRGKFFDLPEDQRKPSGDVVIERQPRCAFIQHVFTLFPSFHDKQTNAQKPTGQKFIIKNDAPFDHNFNLVPQSDENLQKSDTLKPGTEEAIPTLTPQTKPIRLNCNIHNWMVAYGFVLEHPYVAITKDDGSFEIKNAPLGVPLQVVAWHEGTGFFYGGEDGMTTTLTDKMALPLPKIKGR